MNRMVPVLLAFGLGLPATPMISVGATAASFDCSRATTAFERAICDDADLSRQDETLAVAYATAIGGLTADAGAAMRAGQREWLAYVERACTPDGEPLTVPYDRDGIACLSSELRQRIEGLEHSRMIGGYRFYLVERFGTEPPEGEEDWNKVTTRSFTSVRIDDDDPLAMAFNAWAEAESAPLASAFAPPEPPAEGEADEEDFQSDSSNSMVVDRVLSRLISLEVTEYWYGHGAAHGNYAISYRHFRTDENRALAASDIFAGEDWGAPLAEKVSAALRAAYGDGLWDDADAAVAEAVVDPSRWRFSEAGMSFRFQPYEVTAYAAGAPTATVAWHELRDILTEDAESLGSF